MTTTDQVLLIILTVLLSVFFLLLIAMAAISFKLLNEARKVVAKANDVADSVADAAEAFRDVQGRMALFKLIRNIVKLAKKRGR
ncbi:MAG TPA: hypothetical protein VN778_01760 [Verrucomicrobiae bacterium]|nr:hypothetical protein [Verrucomicrobiae bacterium]